MLDRQMIDAETASGQREAALYARPWIADMSSKSSGLARPPALAPTEKSRFTAQLGCVMSWSMTLALGDSDIQLRLEGCS